MGNLGGGELLVIFLVALIVLGPTKLPDAARQAGRAMRQLRQITDGFREEFRSAVDDLDVETQARERGRQAVARSGADPASIAPPAADPVDEPVADPDETLDVAPAAAATPVTPPATPTPPPVDEPVADPDETLDVAPAAAATPVTPPATPTPPPVEDPSTAEDGGSGAAPAAGDGDGPDDAPGSETRAP